MKLLNLDDLIPTERFVRIKGVDYSIAEQSLGNLIDAIKCEKNVDRQDQAAFFEHMLDSAAALIPDAPREIVRTLSPRQLTAVVEFASARDEMLPDADEAAQASEEGK